MGPNEEDSFLNAARKMNDRGWFIHLEDAYRSAPMQTAELMLRRLSAFIAIGPKLGTHMSGSAIDISLMSLDNG